MKATPEDQLRLLDLQKVDAEIDLLNYKAKNLPEHSQISELEVVKQNADSELGLVSIDEADVKREVAKADADAEQVRTRKTRDEARLASGQGSAKDLEHLQHELVSLTRRVNDLEEIELEIFGAPKKVKIRGYIDRIDSIGEKIRIIDYKSGKVDESEVKFFTQGDVKEVSIKSMKEKKHILQLMQYAYLYAKKHNVYPESSIISFVSGKHAPFTLNTNKFDYNECIERFPEFLKEIIEDIYDKDVPFSHNSNDFRSYCQYCD